MDNERPTRLHGFQHNTLTFWFLVGGGTHQKTKGEGKKGNKRHFLMLNCKYIYISIDVKFNLL